MKRTILLLFLLQVPICLSAQQPDCRHRTIPFNAVDKQQVPVTNLSLENLSGKFHGKPVRFTSVKLITGPRRVVILLDLSRSMRDGFRYRAAAFFAAHLLVAMPSSSRVGVITFADKVVVQTKQLQDPQAVMGLLREIAAADLGLARGATSLLDAIVAAVHLLGPPRPGDVIYAITDGDDTASQSRKAEVEKLLISAGIRFYATLLYEESAPGYFSETTVSEISKLTEATGGTSQRFEITENIWSGDTKGLSEKGLKRVRDSADFLAKQFAHYYSVDLELPEEVDKPRKLELELVPDSKLQTKGLKLFYPTKLLPCSLRTESRP